MTAAPAAVSCGFLEQRWDDFDTGSSGVAELDATRGLIKRHHTSCETGSDRNLSQLENGDGMESNTHEVGFEALAPIPYQITGFSGLTLFAGSTINL